MDFFEGEVLAFDKPYEWTSFGIVAKVRWLLTQHLGRKIKVGHAGTLDKFASGLMIVLTGGATKLNPAFSSFDKEYLASIRFGEETDTLDPEGSVIRTAPLPSEETLRSVLPSFLGRQKQIPPIYSALHVGGKRAYREARKGNEIEMPERDVEITSLELLSFDGREAVIRTSVSKGTYIRSLARDIASAAGSAGHLSHLRRLRIGPWRLEDIGRSTWDLLSSAGLFSEIKLSERERKRIENGTIVPGAILSDSAPERPYAFLRFSDELYGIGEKRDGRLRIIERLS